MNTISYLQLIEEYKALSHQDKYDKLLVYLHAAQKSEENLIGLYLIIDGLGIDGMDDDTMVELYDAFVFLVEYDDSTKLQKAEHTLSYLQNLKQREQEERTQEQDDADTMLNDI